MHLGFIFMVLSFGYLISCQTVSYASLLFDSRRLVTVGFLINGLATMFYGPFEHFKL